MENKIHCPL